MINLKPYETRPYRPLNRLDDDLPVTGGCWDTVVSGVDIPIDAIVDDEVRIRVQQVLAHALGFSERSPRT